MRCDQCGEEHYTMYRGPDYLCKVGSSDLPTR